MVKFIEDSKAIIDQQGKFQHMNAQSYYRWILSLVETKSVAIEYTAGHSDEATLPSIMNYEADHYASGSQKYLEHVSSTLPTFMMDDSPASQTVMGGLNPTSVT